MAQAAARVLIEMEEYDAGGYDLSDERLQEVQRRIADRDPMHISLDGVRERFARSA